MNKTLLILSAGLMLMAALIGCEVRPKGADLSAADTATAYDWPYVPVNMRIHPFTSVTFDERREVTVLEARIELLDVAGDMTKGVGQFHFELFDIDPRASVQGQQMRQLYSWEVSIENLQANQRYYDPITRTYAFDLKMAQMPARQSTLRLAARFTDHRGRHFRAEVDLATSGSD
jgi:hypothetical protein